MQNIQTVCIIGSGVMGSGIAAQVANSGTKVILLDINDVIVNKAYNNLFSTKPPPLSHPDYAKNIELGSLKSDIALIKEADLVIEVIIEKLEIKHKLYDSISGYLKETAILASNTSTLPLKLLKEKLPKNIKSRFIITHFFNPPRYMELIELVTDSETDHKIIPRISNFLYAKLGKTIVNCNDTPGFIANRVGCFLLELVTRRAIKAGFSPYQIDCFFSKALGFPSTGIFGLYDLIGHDVMELISKSLLNSLPQDDKYHEIYTKCDVLDKMKERNLIGRKVGAGFYRINKDSKGNKVKEVLKYKDMTYGEIGNQNESVQPLIHQIMEEFFSYVNSLIPSVTTKKEDIDQAMILGYSLKYGPFELMEKLHNNHKNNAKSIVDHENKVILENNFATLSLINDRHIFKMKTKMNILNPEIFYLMDESIHYLEKQKLPMYIFPEGNNFSAGADLNYFQQAIEEKNFKKIEDFLIIGQQTMLRLKYAKVPVIACARGVALGGGTEILLHVSSIVAHQNLNAGLVELGIGLIPAFGGTKEMFLRCATNKNRLVQNLKNILNQNKSSSADYFSRDYNIKCSISMHRDLLIEKATIVINKRSDSQNEKKITLPKINLHNEFDILALDSLQVDIVSFFQKIIDKETVTEQELLDLEREKFLELAGVPRTLEKIKTITNHA